MLRIAFFLNVLDYARSIAELVPFAVDDTKAFVCVELPDLLERLVAELVKDTAQIKRPNVSTSFLATRPASVVSRAFRDRLSCSP